MYFNSLQGVVNIVIDWDRVLTKDPNTSSLNMSSSGSPLWRYIISEKISPGRKFHQFSNFIKFTGIFLYYWL